MYGPYRAHDPVKNWIIGGMAVVVLIVVIVAGALNTKSSLTSTLDSFTALPSSGSNTVAWYWTTQLGSSTPTARPLNVDTADFTTMVTSVQDNALAYFVALGQHGDAYVWGRPSGPTAPLKVTLQPTAVTMPPGVRFTSIATNDGYVLALDQTGHLWNWGDVNRDELGPGARPPETPQSPLALPTPPGVTFRAISTGWSFSLALDSTGRAWTWGTNGGDGSLGLVTNETFVAAPTPIEMPPGVSFTDISAGWVNAVALDSAGRAWAWGDDTEGQLGVDASAVPTTGPAPCGQFLDCSATPLLVNTPPNVRLTAIAAGEDYVAAVDSTGRIWTWGTNDYGALGLGSAAATTCATPTDCNSNGGPRQPTNSTPAVAQTPADVRFVAVAVTQGDQAGEDATVALDNHGAAWAWGSNLILQFRSGTGACFSPENQPGTLTPGTELCMLKPTQLEMPADVAFKAVSASTDAVLGLPR
jgi:alpha-tubulin suppressor-like RCC1 family protein